MRWCTMPSMTVIMYILIIKMESLSELKPHTSFLFDKTWQVENSVKCLA